MALFLGHLVLRLQKLMIAKREKKERKRMTMNVEKFV
jgi:hypothetical protein